MADQWESFSTGGDYPIYLLVHRACGAVVAHRSVHEAVCTAPPWEPPKVPIGEVRDFEADGTVRIVQRGTWE